MEKVIFSKCSLERRDSFKIITTIKNVDGQKKVYKKAACDRAMEHIQNMVLFYEQHQHDENVKYAASRVVGSDKIEIDYVEGKSLLSIMEKHSKKVDFDKLMKDFVALKNIITNQPMIEEFYTEEAFTDVFGECKLSSEYKASRSMNIDVLAENIIVNDDGYYVIDYEWSLPFLIPIKYVLFRALYFNPVFSQLDTEKRNVIKDEYEISDDEYEMFEKMELSFQKHISGINLNEIYNYMGQPLKIVTNDLNILELNQIKIYDEKEQIIFTKQTVENEVVLSVSVCNAGKIKIQLCEDKCIIKIKKLLLDDRDVVEEIESNAVLVINDDYYFGTAPLISVDTGNVEKMMIHYTVMNKGNVYIEDYALNLKGNHDKELELIEATRVKEHYIQAANKFRDEKDKLNEEFETIKSGRGWKLYASINKFDK